MIIPWRRFIIRPKAAVVKNSIVSVVLVIAKVAHGLEVERLRESNIHISPISIKVRLLGPFIPFFILLIWVNPVTVIILARVAASLLEEPILDF